MIEKTFFYIFAGLALLAASGVIFSKNQVRSVLFLVTVFVATAALWLLLQAEFLAVLLALIYIGAVLILFLFIVMLFGSKTNSNEKRFNVFMAVGISMAGLLASILIYVVAIHGFKLEANFAFTKQIVGQSELVQIGDLLFTKYLVPFEMAGVLLLTAIVAVIGLTMKDHKE